MGGCAAHLALFSFRLGWTFRKFKGKLIIKPSPKTIKAFSANLTEIILRCGKAWPKDLLIAKLNQQICGWANYHQSVSAKDAFSHMDYILYELLWKWTKRRHPKKNHRWISQNYWHSKGSRNWVFSAEDVQLISLVYIPIIRHAKGETGKGVAITDEVLEPYDGKPPRAVLSRESGSNPADLADNQIIDERFVIQWEQISKID